MARSARPLDEKRPRSWNCEAHGKDNTLSQSIATQTTALMPFSYGSHAVRTVLIDGEPWFVLADLCTVLGIESVARVASRLDEGVRSKHTLETAGGRQAMTVVNEAGMYDVVIRSDKAEAIAFRRWITSEVLPSIRKTGSYAVNPPSGAELMALAVLEAQRTIAASHARVAELEERAAEDEPKVAYVDTFVADGDLRLMRNVAKSLGVSESQLRAELVNHGWVYVESSTRWSDSEQRKLRIFRYSAYAEKRDYFAPVPNHDAPRFKGELMHTLKVTPAGALAIARALKTWGVAA
ncbi:hypothetical protein C5E05_01640 [Pseudoclavibacter sp. AY1H1]|nr:hypothetical protein C5E05_01640 [Pseudoclavibacter sp. AY1H1]